MTPQDKMCFCLIITNGATLKSAPTETSDLPAQKGQGPSHSLLESHEQSDKTSCSQAN